MSINNLLLAGRFLAVGATNTIFGLAVIFGLMFFFGVNPAISNLVGYACGLILGYFLNKNWSFKSKNIKEKVFFRYLIVIFIAYLLNLGMTYFGILFLNLNSYISQIVGMIFYTLFSFMGCSKFVFQLKGNDAV